MAEDTTAFDPASLPTGLAEMIGAFVAGCDARSKRVAPQVLKEMAERFHGIFDENQELWTPSAAQVLTLARLAGRLAATYAEVDGRLEVDWTHARFALRDAQEECRENTRRRGKYCENVYLGP